jgi:hypothetical protein
MCAGAHARSPLGETMCGPPIGRALAISLTAADDDSSKRWRRAVRARNNRDRTVFTGIFSRSAISA